MSPEKGALDFIDVCKELNMDGVMAGDDRLIPDEEYVEEVIYKVQPGRYNLSGRSGLQNQGGLAFQGKGSGSSFEFQLLRVFGLFLLKQ